MRFLIWALAYFVGLILETSVLPVFFSTGAPGISSAILIICITYLSFTSGMWLAAFAGLIRDFLFNPGFSASQVFLVMFIFLAMHLFRVISQWDEPLYRVSSVVVGFAVWPFALMASLSLNQLVLGQSLALGELFSGIMRLVGNELAFILVLLFVFSWFTIRRFTKRRSFELSSI